ncbi:MAG TPA: hypothetical protein VM940_02595 [Chthoniobacterales bacterium]|jgi:hypothetical protein|nr:hypothetical protein [Chthoniobacterales bacterium]
MKAILFCAVALLACGSRPVQRPTEARLIGTWKTAGAIIHNKDGSQTRVALRQKMEITFTADHKEIWHDYDAGTKAVARWRLRGYVLVFKLETASFWGPAGITRREKIKKLSSDELVFTDGRIDGVWTRVR